MRTILAVSFLLASAAYSKAETPTGFEYLTPKEIAEGWILLFDGKSTFGWNVEGGVKIEDGWLVLGGEKETKLQSTFAFGEASLELQLEPATEKDQESLSMYFHRKFTSPPDYGF